MIDVLSAQVFAFLANYFIHSSLFILTLLLALKCKAIGFDKLGEWLMKTVLVLGLLTAVIQTGGWLNHAGWSGVGHQVLTYQLIHETDQKPGLTAINEASQTSMHQENINHGPDITGLITPINGLKSDMSEGHTVEHVIPSTVAESNNLPETVFVMLMVWLSWVVLLVIKYKHQKHQLKILINNRQMIFEVKVIDQFKQLINTAQISQPIHLSQCVGLSSPIALHNEVVLPMNFINEKAPEHINAALAHELAHIKRKDIYWLRFSKVLQILTFFQPLNKVLIQQIHQMTEQRADSLAAMWTKNHRALAETLAAHLIDQPEEKPPFNPTHMVPAMNSKTSHLRQRIENLLNRKSLMRTGRYWPMLITLLMVLVLVMSPGVIAQISKAGSDEQKSGHSYRHNSHHADVDGGITDMSVNYNSDDSDIKLKAKLKGELRFNDDETDVISFPPNSRFDLTVDEGNVEKRLVIKSSKGEGTADAIYTYYEDGDVQVYGQAARNWFAEIIPQVLRNTGLGARERVERIQRTGGDEAVLDEIEMIQSDWVKKSYFNHLFQFSELNNQHLLRAMQLATGIRSDFELSHVLDKMLYTQAIENEQQWLQLLSSTSGIESDFELAKTLLKFQMKLPQSAEINQAYFDAASSIQSDFEMSKVLIKYVDQQQPNTVNLAQMFELAEEIQSDFELAKLMIALNDQMSQASEDVFAGYLNLAEDIQSDFEMKKVYSHLLTHHLSTDNLSQMIESAAEQISSDFELSALFTELLQQNNVDTTIREQVKNAVNKSISSGFERDRVLSLM